MNDSEKDKAPDPSHDGLRFSVGQLLVVTAIVSVVLMVLVTLVPPLWALAASRLPTNAFFDGVLAPVRASGVLPQYSHRIPLLVVWIAGAILLLRGRKQYRRVSQCALAGLAGLLVIELVSIGQALWWSHAFLNAQAGAQLVGSPAVAPTMPTMPPLYSELVAVWRYLRPVLEACSWVLILMAVLGWRGEASEQDAPKSCQ
jgi:hypothetical protein